MRKQPIVTGEYYHIYNRGVDKRDIFNDKEDLHRFIESICEFNQIDGIGSIRDLRKSKSESKALHLPISKIEGNRILEIFNGNKDFKKHCDEIVEIIRQERGKTSLLEEDNLPDRV